MAGWLAGGWVGGCDCVLWREMAVVVYTLIATLPYYCWQQCCMHRVFGINVPIKHCSKSNFMVYSLAQLGSSMSDCVAAGCSCTRTGNIIAPCNDYTVDNPLSADWYICCSENKYNFTERETRLILVYIHTLRIIWTTRYAVMYTLPLVLCRCISSKKEAPQQGIDYDLALLSPWKSRGEFGRGLEKVESEKS